MENETIPKRVEEQEPESLCTNNTESARPDPASLDKWTPCYPLAPRRLRRKVFSLRKVLSFPAAMTLQKYVEYL